MTGVSTYRVCWARPAYMAWRVLRLSVIGAAPAMSRWAVWRLARADLPTHIRRTLRELAADGLVPPWQAEREAVGCRCNAARGWTRAQAIRRVEAIHAERVRMRCCEDRPDLRVIR